MLTPTEPAMLFSTGTKPPSDAPGLHRVEDLLAEGAADGFHAGPKWLSRAASLYAPRTPW